MESLEVVNDFTAMALSVPRLEAGDKRAIGGGEPRPRAPVAVLGPGTGLGVSGLVPAGDGGWIVNLARAIAEIDGEPAPPGDPALIAAAAHTDPLAGQALDMFASMLGTAASNLGLGARGGVYIGGGIVPRLGRRFQTAGSAPGSRTRAGIAVTCRRSPTYVITQPEPACSVLAALAASPGTVTSADWAILPADDTAHSFAVPGSRPGAPASVKGAVS